MAKVKWKLCQYAGPNRLRPTGSVRKCRTTAGANFTSRPLRSGFLAHVGHSLQGKSRASLANLYYMKFGRYVRMQNFI